MTMKKTVRVPVADDGVPIVAAAQQLEKTRELPVCGPADGDLAEGDKPTQAAPQEILDDNLTVPVQSSIESTVTFELLRRQSTEEEDDDGKP
jgi:hypothetical protein